jgi:glycogen debranching enzyme
MAKTGRGVKPQGGKKGGERAKGGGRPSANDVKTRLLTRKNPSAASGIIEASVIKDGDLFLLTRGDGMVPFEGNHGFGLYRHDCRYLDGLRISLNGKPLDSLSSTTADGFRSVFQLTNPSLPRPGGHIHEHSLGVRLTHLLSHDNVSMRDILEIRNFGSETVELELRIFLRAQFEDVFNIRGLDERRPGRAERPKWKGPVLELGYRGGDGTLRRLSARFPDSVRKGRGAEARLPLRLRPDQTRALEWVFLIREDGDEGSAKESADAVPGAEETHRIQVREREEHVSGGAVIECDHEILSAAIRQALLDLRSLQSQYRGRKFIAAGIPWFATLFGRDAITACLQTLAFDPEASQGTLRLLAEMQGAKVDRWTDEQPGRILHEFRRGELARAGLIPYTPFYGTVDANALFLILLAEYSRWAGDLDLFRDLRSAVDSALAWMDRYGDANGDGFLEYAYPRVGAQINLGWKDSGDAVVKANGSLAKSPISLIEVQGYAYRARRSIADLLRRNGEDGLADELDRKAADLRVRFDAAYWMDGKGFYAMALDGSGGQADVVSSNPGQALWGGIVDPARAEAVRDRLMSEDMYSGWGIRTLSAREKRFNPMSYHLGSVWPHDNSLIASGFRDYGFDREAMRLFESLIAAADHFAERRLPELFCGFGRGAFPEPVRYPIACHPQAWASGSLPYMLATLLGLRPDGFAGRLRIERPMLPEGCRWLEWKRLRVGRARADLRFERDGDRVGVRALEIRGNLELEIAGA